MYRVAFSGLLCMVNQVIYANRSSDKLHTNFKGILAQPVDVLEILQLQLYSLNKVTVDPILSFTISKFPITLYNNNHIFYKDTP